MQCSRVGKGGASGGGRPPRSHKEPLMPPTPLAPHTCKFQHPHVNLALAITNEDLPTWCHEEPPPPRKFCQVKCRSLAVLQYSNKGSFVTLGVPQQLPIPPRKIDRLTRSDARHDKRPLADAVGGHHLVDGRTIPCPSACQLASSFLLAGRRGGPDARWSILLGASCL